MVCDQFGSEWNVSYRSDGSSICTIQNTTYKENCEDCSKWRMAIFSSGSNEEGSTELTRFNYSTVEGHYYRGLTPCHSTLPGAYPSCGEWKGNTK